MKPARGLHGLIVLSLVSGSSLVQAGSVLTWPGSGACANTLQACIDAAPQGAIIDLVPAALIDETVAIPRSMTLRGRSAGRASFAEGRGISANTTGSAGLVLRVHDLGFRNGRIQITHAGSGRADIELSGLQMRANTPTTPSGILVDLGSTTSTEQHRVRIENNDLELVAPSLFDAGIQLLLHGSGRRALFDVRHNRVRSGAAGSGMGIEFDAAVGADLDVVLHANDIQGAFAGAVRISEGRFSSTPATLRAKVVSNAIAGDGNYRGGGLSVVTYNGTIELEALNNTLVFGNGLIITHWGGGTGTPTGQVSGGVYNNLIAFNRFGLQNTASLGGLATTDWNLKWQNVSPGVHTAGANDLNVDPQLRSMLAPRLSAVSPARNAGNGLALLRVPAELGRHDADGLRRLVGAIDIGAFEFGHRTLARRKPTASAQPEFAVVDAELDADPNRRLFLTRNYGASPVANPVPVGVSHFDQWFVTNLNGQAMGQNVAFNLFAPLGASTTGLNQHLASGGNTLDGSTVIDWSAINAQPDIFLLVTQSTPLGTPFHQGPVVPSYVGNRWNLVTANGSNLQINTRWNLYAQVQSPHAFRHVVREDNRNGAAGSLISHPRLDGVACAQIQVTPLSNGSVAGSIVDVEYVDTVRRHRIFSNNGNLPLGSAFNVLVLSEQIEDCAGGALFRDSFEGS